jgi:hypothetical protein
MASLSPTQLLKLWNRVDERYGLPQDKGKKLQGKAKQAEQDGTLIEKGLTKLRNVARQDMKNPATVTSFEQTRVRTGKLLKKYCKLLKNNDLKDSVQDLACLRKAVKQLTVLVDGLAAQPDVEGEADLNALNHVDTTALDKAMEDPHFGEYSQAELEAEEEDQAGAPPALPPLPGPRPSVPPSGGPSVPPAVHKQLLLAVQAWRKASDSVDAQITALQAALRKDDDEDMHEIADKGLNAVTGNYKVRLMAALHEAVSTDGAVLKQVAAKGLPVVKGFRSHLNSDVRVAACDDNPFGVKVSIRQTLGSALTELEAAFTEVKKV